MKGQLVRFVKPIVERFPKVAMTYRSVRDNWQWLEIPEETPMGFKFIGNKAMQLGLFETKETDLVKELLHGVDVFVNVGANVGYYCCIALSLGKYVVAFEPITRNLRSLLKNIKANNWESSIEIFPLALSNKVGAVEIYGGGVKASLIRGWSGTPEQYVSLVPASTMDIVLGSRFRGQRCLVLVDVEGAEKFMIEGAPAFLCAEPKPIWMVEISILEHQPKGTHINPRLFETFQAFWESGYEAWTANRQCRQICSDEVERIVMSGKDTLRTHNFLFIDRNESKIVDRLRVV